jgi:hypothetical protein
VHYVHHVHRSIEQNGVAGENWGSLHTCVHIGDRDEEKFHTGLYGDCFSSDVLERSTTAKRNCCGWTSHRLADASASTRTTSKIALQQQ